MEVHVSSVINDSAKNLLHQIIYGITFIAQASVLVGLNSSFSDFCCLKSEEEESFSCPVYPSL